MKQFSPAPITAFMQFSDLYWVALTVDIVKVILNKMLLPAADLELIRSSRCCRRD